MPGIKSSFFTGVNSALLKSGAVSGFDQVSMGAGIGGALGAINGSFSEYDGTISGAMKGAMIGGIGMTGLKYAGSRYARGYADKFGTFDPIKHAPLLDEMAKVNPGYMSHASNKGQGWFNVELPDAYNSFTAMTKHVAGVP